MFVCCARVKKSLKSLEVCNFFFSAISTHYYVYLLPLDLLLVVVVVFFFFWLTCVCRVGLNLPHKTGKNKTLIVNPSGDEHQNPSDDDDDDEEHQE